MNSSRPIIIKRPRKKGHAEAHGGSWKVAYADFVTAMMAFFLLLWLLTMVSPDKRIALSEYFNNHAVFTDKSLNVAGGKSFMPGNPTIMETMVIRNRGKADRTPAEQSDMSRNSKKVTSEEMAERLRESVNRKLRYLKDQILVDIVEGGVRIQIIDLAGSMMFSSGSDAPTEKAIQILDLVADNIRDVSNRIAVEGHTDAAPFVGGRTTNWELSSARASAARRVLERKGIDSERVARVVGYADQELFVKEDPRDPRNRRISIILLQKSGEPSPRPVKSPDIPQPQTAGAGAFRAGQTPGK